MSLSIHNIAKIDIVTIRLVISCSQTRNLTAAARQNNIALAAASRRIKDIEQTIGNPLFIRSTKGMSLTETGDIVLKHGLQILNSIESMGMEIKDHNNKAARHINLSSSSAGITEYLPELLSEYDRIEPFVRVDVKEMVSEAVVQHLREGRTDIGIFVEGTEASDLAKYFFRRDELVFVFHRNHKLGQVTKPLHFTDLLNEEWICLSAGAASLQKQLEASLSEHHPFKIRMQLQSFDAVCSMVSHGLGIALLPKKSIIHLIKGLQLSWRPVADKWAKRRLLIATKNNEKDRHVLKLIEFLRSEQFSSANGETVHIKTK